MPRKKQTPSSSLGGEGRDILPPSSFAATSPTTPPPPLTETGVNKSADEAWSKLSRAVHNQLDMALMGQADLSPQAVIATLKFVEASREVAKTKQTGSEAMAKALLRMPVFNDDDE